MLMALFAVKANIVDPDQTAPKGNSDLGPLCLLQTSQRRVWNKLAGHMGNDIYVLYI